MNKTLMLCALLGLGCSASDGLQSTDAGAPKPAHATDAGTHAADADAGPPEPVAEDHYIAARVAAETDLAARCCKRIGALGVADAIVPGIKQREEREVPLPDSGATYDPQAAGVCIAALRGSDCTPLKAGSMEGPEWACNKVYARGHKKITESCQNSYDCALDGSYNTYCAPWDAQGSACMRLVEAGQGEPCDRVVAPNTVLTCKSPLLCDPNSQKCVALAARGQTCITAANPPYYGDTCAAGSVCDRNGSKQCVAPWPPGHACDPNGLCEGFACYGGKCREPLWLTSDGGLCKWQ